MPQGGYKLTLKNDLNYCKGNDEIFKVSKDFSVQLNDNCDLIISKGCFETTGFKTANVRIVEKNILFCPAQSFDLKSSILYNTSFLQVKYTINRNGRSLFSSSLDVCDLMDYIPTMAQTFLQMLGIPSKCPIENVN